jgi:lipopolysaccharide transport system permease protein
MKKVSRKWLCAWEALIFHTACALKAEFSRYYLHFMWWFLDPIFHLAILYTVFGIFLASNEPNYALFLLTGIVLWQWFGNTVTHAARSIYNSMRMFQQIKVQPLHFPLMIFLQDLAKYAPVFIAFLIAISIFSPAQPSLVWLDIFPIMLVQAMCIIGCAILFAAVVPLLPDLALVIPIMVQALFFASGIFFNIEQALLPQHRIILYSNPIAVCIKSMRDVLVYGHHPDWFLLAYATAVSLLILGIGLVVITSSRKMYSRLIEQ